MTLSALGATQTHKVTFRIQCTGDPAFRGCLQKDFTLIQLQPRGGEPRAHARHSDLAEEVQSGGQSQGGRYEAKKPEVTQLQMPALLILLRIQVILASFRLAQTELITFTELNVPVNSTMLSVLGAVALRRYSTSSSPGECVKKANFCSSASDTLTGSSGVLGRGLEGTF